MRGHVRERGKGNCLNPITVVRDSNAAPHVKMANVGSHLWISSPAARSQPPKSILRLPDALFTKGSKLSAKVP